MQKHFRYSNSRFLQLESMGVSATKVLRHADLSQELLNEPRFLLTTEEAFAFGEAIAEVSGNPAIGLVLGTVARTQNFNPPGIAALCSEALGEAMAQVGRYKQLTCPEELVQHKSKGEWSLRFRFLMTEKPEPPVLIQAGFSYLLSIARHGEQRLQSSTSGTDGLERPHQADQAALWLPRRSRGKAQRDGAPGI